MSIGSTGKIGESVFAYNFVNFPEYNHSRCEIVSNLQHWKRRHKHGPSDVALCYKVKLPDGRTVIAEPTQLYRKPPKKVHTEWADKKVKELVNKSKQNTEAYVHSTV